MTLNTLTYDEALLLQSYVDHEATPQEKVRAEELLERSSAARVYVSALEELSIALRMAEEAAWETANMPAPEEWVELARMSATLVEVDLEELAPMLERFHDGEVDYAEAATVAALLEEREDVAEYLSELDRLSDGIRQAGQIDAGIDFAGLWDGIEAEIGKTEEAPQTSTPIDPFDAAESTVLIHRYHDGEVTDEERRRVENWIEADEPVVDGLLGAMAEIHVGINAGLDIAREKIDAADIWTGIEAQLDEIDAQADAPNVVSLDGAPDSGDRQRASQGWNRPVFAVAAMVVLIFIGSLLGSQLWQTEKIVETRTVVIFDSVEAAPGSSVILPQLASHDGADNDDVPILWIMDDEQEDSEYEESESDEDMDGFHGPI